MTVGFCVLACVKSVWYGVLDNIPPLYTFVLCLHNGLVQTFVKYVHIGSSCNEFAEIGAQSCDIMWQQTSFSWQPLIPAE